MVYWAVVHSTAQTLFENDIRFYSKPKVTLTHYSEYAITEKFGIADYVFVTDDWGEFTVGPYYKFTPNSLVTVLPGLETDGKFRIGFYGYVTFKDYTLSAFYKIGIVDYWDYQFRKHINGFTIMIRARQGYGFGVPMGFRYKQLEFMYTTYVNIEDNKQKLLPTLSFNLIL